MIEIRSLTKQFGHFTAVDRVSLEVGAGEVLGFLGPNGAGKSTTMRMVTGFLPPTSGTALIRGKDVIEQPLAARSQLGYLPEGAPAYPEMTPESFLAFVARARGMSRADAKRRAAVVKELVHLEGVFQQPIETLSKGYKRRVGLAQALIHDPPVLILDEPTDGLDPNQKHEVRELIRTMASSKAVVLSTHILEEVEAVCTRAVVISAGRIVADGTPAELAARAPEHGAVRLRFEGGVPSGAADALRGLAGIGEVRGVEAGGPLLALPADGAAPVAAVSGLAREQGWRLAELTVVQGRLDDVFRSITQSDVQEVSL